MSAKIFLDNPRQQAHNAQPLRENAMQRSMRPTHAPAADTTALGRLFERQSHSFASKGEVREEIVT